MSEERTLAGSSANASPAPSLRRAGQLTGITLVFACGTALFSDGYVNAIAGPVNTILKSYVYKDYDKDALHRFSSLFSALAFAGNLLGMLVFGVLSDRIGRKFGMIFASVWLAICALLSACAYGAGGSTGGLFAALEAYRFLAGIAIGAEYPAGSVAASENTEAKDVPANRQQMYFIIATNTMIDFGFVVASFVPLLLLWIFGMDKLEWVWRLSLGIGVIPPLAVLYFRMGMDETDHYRQSSMKNVPWGLVLKKYGPRLAAVSLSWFIYDWVSYPAGIYSSFFVDEITPNANLHQSLAWGIALNAFYIPGTIAGAFVADKLGPKKTILLGLLAQSLFGFLLAGFFPSLRGNLPLLIVIYGIYICFGEFGPGNNLGILASKAVAPTAVRGTFYGIAACIGKIGAFTGTYVYDNIQAAVAAPGENLYFSAPFYIGSALALVSACLIYFFVPPVVKDGMLKIDAEFKEYLAANGVDTTQMGVQVEDDAEAEAERHAKQ
ncbi:hypothetical protein GGF32_006229 [Allomyces javanicus]|nr:hypothetical protein GGF32_006229 [Allomyces javanicus]